MGKKNSKLKQDTIDRLTNDTYCEYRCYFFVAKTDCSRLYHAFYKITRHSPPLQRSVSATSFLFRRRVLCIFTRPEHAAELTAAALSSDATPRIHLFNEKRDVSSPEETTIYRIRTSFAPSHSRCPQSYEQHASLGLHTFNNLMI